MRCEHAGIPRITAAAASCGWLRHVARRFFLEDSMNGLFALIPAPVRALLAAVVVAGLVGLGYWLGAGIERGRAAERERDASALVLAGTQQAVATARADAEAESARRAETALRHARADARAREIRLKGQIHAVATNRPECRMPDADVRLLNDAVDAANDFGSAPDPTPGSLPAALPEPAAPG